jgi:hypothetical protein
VVPIKGDVFPSTKKVARQTDYSLKDLTKCSSRRYTQILSTLVTDHNNRHRSRKVGLTRKNSQEEKEFSKIRTAVLKRDEHRCVKCGSEIRLEVHHTAGYKDNRRHMLRTLCNLCHWVAPYGDAYWKWELYGISGPDQLQGLVLDEFLSRNASLDKAEAAIIVNSLTPSCLAGINRFERSQNSVKIRGALQRAKDDGAHIGRPFSLNEDQRAEVRLFLERGESVSAIAKLHGTTRQTVMRVREDLGEAAHRKHTASWNPKSKTTQILSRMLGSRVANSEKDLT